MTVEYDKATGAYIVRNAEGRYVGYVTQHADKSWSASGWDGPLGRHVHTGGYHVSQDLAVLALPAEPVYRR